MVRRFGPRSGHSKVSAADADVTGRHRMNNLELAKDLARSGICHDFAKNLAEVPRRSRYRP
jgi:hypothetical protein